MAHFKVWKKFYIEKHHTMQDTTSDKSNILTLEGRSGSFDPSEGLFSKPCSQLGFGKTWYSMTLFLLLWQHKKTKYFLNFIDTDGAAHWYT